MKFDYRSWIPSLAVSAALLVVGVAEQSAQKKIEWVRLSSKDGNLPSPGGSNQQTGSQVADLDGDGVNDFVISFRKVAPALVWYRRHSSGWERYVIESEFLTVEAGGASFDLDGDGDLDLVFGNDAQGDKLWWWENPAPHFDSNVSWKRRLIKSGGARQHHDQVFADLKGAGRPQLVFWNQGAKTIFIADIPPAEKLKDQGATETWPMTAIFSGSAGERGDQSGGFKYPEGLSVADVDADGKLDLLGGNYWFKHEGGNRFQAIRIGDIGGRIEAGRFKRGKFPQVVVAPGDGSGPVKFYECKGDPLKTEDWTGRDLVGRDIVHGHTLDLGDINGDGHLDIFTAEMAKWTNKPDPADHPQATAWIFYGDGKGGFEKTELVVGHGWHEGRVADLDGDGDLDLLNKPYTWDTPRVDVWLNNGVGPRRAPVFKASGSFKGALALQLYSLREWFKKEGVPLTLARVRTMGFTSVEVAGTYGLTPRQFRSELDRAGLKAAGMHVNYNDLGGKIEQIIGDAKTIGVEYVGCASIPRKGQFTAEDAARAAEHFNTAGEKLNAAGLKFMYHPHGFEFVPTSNGRTLFDDLVAQTKPELVDFELDIFWAYHGGVDPAQLLARYPRRFALLHLKDMKPGTERNLTGRAPDESSVALGSGVIDVKAVLRAARRSRAKWFIIEEESPEPLVNVPAGLRFLEQVKY